MFAIKTTRSERFVGREDEKWRYHVDLPKAAIFANTTDLLGFVTRQVLAGFNFEAGYEIVRVREVQEPHLEVEEL